MLCTTRPDTSWGAKGTENHLKGLVSAGVRQAAASNRPLYPEHPAGIPGGQTQREWSGWQGPCALGLQKRKKISHGAIDQLRLEGTLEALLAQHFMGKGARMRLSGTLS